MSFDSNLWSRPVSPHYMNEEFESDTLSSDWYNYSGVAADFGTIEYGTVDLYDTTYNSGNVLRMNLNSPTRRSWAMCQSPLSRWMLLGREYTPPTNVLVMARIKNNIYYQSITDFDRNCAIWLLEDNGSGKPDPNYRVSLYLSIAYSGALKASFSRTVAGGLYDQRDTTSVAVQGQALEYIAIHKLGTVYHAWVGTAAGNWIYMDDLAFTYPIAHVGFYMNSTTSNRPAVSAFGIDFMRFYETDNFLF